ncbi:hypothetical protein KY358_03580 [Candidatus Woesearchaeota archaeon]|nr:hypothetical protein [Candidatus Woesearchaeota archaeon]
MTLESRVVKSDDPEIQPNLRVEDCTIIYNPFKIEGYGKNKTKDGKLNLIQSLILNHLVEFQWGYVITSNPFNLNYSTEYTVAEEMKLNQSTVHRSLKDIIIKLVDGNLIPASQLVPGKTLMKLRALYALRELQKDPNFFYAGSWKIRGKALRKELKERYNLDMAIRTLNNYRQSLST